MPMALMKVLRAAGKDLRIRPQSPLGCVEAHRLKPITLLLGAPFQTLGIRAAAKARQSARLPSMPIDMASTASRRCSVPFKESSSLAPI